MFEVMGGGSSYLDPVIECIPHCIPHCTRYGSMLPDPYTSHSSTVKESRWDSPYAILSSMTHNVVFFLPPPS